MLIVFEEHSSQKKMLYRIVSKSICQNLETIGSMINILGFSSSVSILNGKFFLINLFDLVLLKNTDAKVVHMMERSDP